MSDFSITSNELIDFTLSLQKINDVALPFAVQEALNETVKDVKKRTLAETTNSMFDVKRKGFFKANSGFQSFNAKQFGYNINKMHADVGITKNQKPNETATEQVGNQQTATPIKRSINPLGNKPKSTDTINILSKKPEFYDSSQNYSEGNGLHFLRTVQKAKRRGAGIVIHNGRKGVLNKIGPIRQRKPTKADPRKYTSKLTPIASYLKDGSVKLTKHAPFLNNAAEQSVKQVMNENFIKAAERQIERAMKK